MTQLIESIKMAWAALTANKLRASLTMLGVVIGITFVLLMGWMLAGLDNSLEQTLSIMGDDILYVDRFEWGSGKWFEQRNRRDVDYKQYQLARERIKTAEYVLPMTRRRGVTIQYESLQITNGDVSGTTSEYLSMLGNNIASGRFFSAVEDQSGAPVIVIGRTLVDNLFNGDPDAAIGRTLKVSGIPFRIVGTMPKRGTMLAEGVDNQVFIPIRRFFNLYGSRSPVVISVKAGGVDRIEDVKYETIGVMRQIRMLAPEAEDDFGVNTADQFREQSAQLRGIVGGVGIAMTGLAFVVGAIGIMNIMFVSVTERTKEIGIRKAVGATRVSILTQFLVEAVMLCLFGSIIGFVITSTIAYVGATVLEVEFLNPTIPLSQVVVAVIVSIGVGVMAGIIPAFRASRMDTVDALRAD